MSGPYRRARWWSDALHPVLDGSDPAVLVILDSANLCQVSVLAPKHSLPYHAAVPKRQLPKAVADALRKRGREGRKKRADARWRMALERPALDLLGVDCGRTASGTAGERVRTRRVARPRDGNGTARS